MPQLIRVPKSSERSSQLIFGKLLTRVLENAENGFGFEGTFLRPGSLVEYEMLWPTAQHPPVPVYLECAGAKSPVGGHRRCRQETHYILWKFDPSEMIWSEIARSSSTSWAWALDLRPVAIRLLRESRCVRLVDREADFHRVVARIDKFLDWQIRRLPDDEQAKAIAAIHDRLYSKLSRSPSLGLPVGY